MQRNHLISFLQVFGILLVVIGHSCQGAPSDPLWFTWIYSFHMPLFMFISGFLLRYGNEKKGMSLADTPLYGSRGFIWKKVKRLLVPYAFISTLAYLPKALLNRFTVRPVEMSWDTYVHYLIYPWDNVIIFFWFLPTLFIIFLLAAYGARLLRRFDTLRGHLVLLAALLLLHLFNPVAHIRLMNLAGVASYLIYFFLGYYCCRYRIIGRLTGHIHAAAAASGLLSLALVTGVPDFMGKDLVAACNGILLSILLGKIYIRHRAHFLNHLYGASYAIYLFSWFPQVASQQVFLSLTHAPWQVGSVLAILTGTYLPLLVYKLIVRYKDTRPGKVAAFLTGQ